MQTPRIKNNTKLQIRESLKEENKELQNSKKKKKSEKKKGCNKSLM